MVFISDKSKPAYFYHPFDLQFVLTSYERTFKHWIPTNLLQFFERHFAINDMALSVRLF